jgi:subtilisin family serine protease
VAASDRIVREAGGRRHHAYTRVLKGFAATLSDAAVERLRNDPDVVAIEQDQEVTIDDVEDQAPWGLDRIDQADRPLDTQYHYNATGAGVYAFIIDTGIRADHVEFGHRVIAGYTAVADGNGTNDCHGHGTHVAGTVGGATYGVAKQVTLVPVRVLGCSGSGSYSGIIAGIDWAVNSNLRPAVANMSLGGARSSIVNSAVARATAAGITMVVAAGNDNSDACTKSPASEPSAITVGATTDTSDTRAVFSNFGTCVDLFAPGVNITSSWNSSPTATNTISGTSMATPHVTGIAALVAAANPSSSPAAISAFIVANASANKIASVGTGSPNLLAYSLGTGTPVEPPPREVAVSSLTGQPQRSGHNWRARISVSVRDLSTGRSASGATVQGTFSTGRSGQCTTNNRGTCNIVSLSTPATTAAIVFTVSDIELTGFAYAADQNAATQVTVNRR